MNAIYNTIVLIQLPLVILITLLSYQTYKTLGVNEFKFISVAFLLNAIRLLIINLHNQSIQVPIYEYLKVIFDVFNSCFFLLACKEYYKKWIGEKPLVNIVIIFSLGIISGLSMIYWMEKTNDVSYINNIAIKLSSIPGSIISVIALLSLAFFLKDICKKFNVINSITNLLFWGSIIYGGIQIYSIINLESLSQTDQLVINLIAYSIALISKCFILIGLYQLYMIAAGKIFKLDLILDRTFHEITIPLISINKNLNNLLTASHAEIPISGKAFDVIERVDSAYNRLIAILSASLKVYRSPTTGRNLARLYEGLFEIPQDDKVESLSINTLIEISIMEIKALNKKTEFDCDYGGKCNIKCNSTELIQVFTNLLKNSSESFNGLPGIIAIRTRNKIVVDSDSGSKLKTVNVEIEDNGTGILPEIIDKIFTDGFSTKKRGSGYGMGIVKNNVEKNAGIILPPESPPKSPIIGNNNTGTRFILIFPRDETMKTNERKM